MIDSHAHMHFDQFDEDRAAVIARARAAGLLGWIEVGVDVLTSRKAIEIARTENVWASVGVHPSDIATIKDGDWGIIEELLAAPRVVAVGEVGFDFYRGGTQEDQLPILQRFVALAVKRNLPVIFHVRDATDGPSAHEAMIRFLQALPDNQRPRGVMHTFSGDAAQAQTYLELGMYLSFSGVVTFKKAASMAEVATTMPLDRLLIETDCPFLAPEPLRGQRNEPAYVKYVASKIAELRGVSLEEITAVTTANTKKLFSIE